MSQKNKDVFSECVVGLFMVAVLALLVYFTVVISGVDLLVGREKTLATVVFRDVGGLKERDDVVFRGMKVGVVERIALAASNTVVTVKVDKGVTMRETGGATVAARSLLGGNYLLLEEGEGAPRPLETTVFRGEPPMDWIRDLGRIARTLNDVAADGGLRSIVSNFAETAANCNVVAARLARGEGTLGRLLAQDDTLYADVKGAVADARRAIGDASTTFAHAASVAARVDRGEGTLGKLLSGDDAVYADLRKTLANAADVSSRLARGEGTLGRLLAKEDAVWGDLTNAVANVRAASEKLKSGKGLLGRALEDGKMADDAARLVANLRTVTDRLERSEGTLGRLVSDGALHDELSALVKDLRQIVDNYRDTTPITTFGSLATGAL